MPFLAGLFWLSQLANVLFLSYSPTAVAGKATVDVRTNYGNLKGIVYELDDYPGQKINAFLGVPFAMPPKGNLRFEKPVSLRNWTGSRNAFELPPSCPPHFATNDPLLYFDEDCLYMNIFTPHFTKGNGQLYRRYPVLFVIHGGAFSVGSAMDYANHTLIGGRFVRKGIVFVAIQYRLGAFGFASTGDDNMPGNYGLWDQIAALRFVHENIEAFGGDPAQVTLYGYSAGSSSVSLLTISPHCADYFQRAIKMSGSLMSCSSSGTFVPRETVSLASEVNCSITDSTKIKGCLKGKTVSELYQGMTGIMATAKPEVCLTRFGPQRLDKELFSGMDHPALIQSTKPKPMVMGFVELDFLLFALIQKENNSLTKLTLSNEQIANFGASHFKEFLRNILVTNKRFEESACAAVVEQIYNFYVNKLEANTTHRDNVFFVKLYAMILSDLVYIVPTIWEAKLRLDAGYPIYLYENKYYNAQVFPERAIVHAMFHAYDHNLLFGNEMIRNSEDSIVSDYLIEWVSNFVLSGNPSTSRINWSPTFGWNDSNSMWHMKISAQPRMEEGMSQEMRRMHFWMDLGRQWDDQFDLVRNIYGGNGAGPSAVLTPGSLVLASLLTFLLMIIMSKFNF